MNFSELLTEWNGGDPRGGPARLKREADIAAATISGYCTGKGRPPSLKMIKRISSAMKVPESRVVDAIGETFNAQAPRTESPVRDDDPMRQVLCDLQELRRNFHDLRRRVELLEAREKKMSHRRAEEVP